MKYIGVGLVFGLIWALLMWARGDLESPVAAIGPIILFGAFGAVLWGARALLLHFRGGRR